jgi:hypothetical protein
MQLCTQGNIRAYLLASDIPPGKTVRVFGIDDVFGPWVLNRLARTRHFHTVGFISHDGTAAPGFPVVAISDYAPGPEDIVLLAVSRLCARFLEFGDATNSAGVWCLSAVPLTNIMFLESCADAPAEALAASMHGPALLAMKSVVTFARGFLAKDSIVFDVASQTGTYLPFLMQRSRAIHAFEATPYLLEPLKQFYGGRHDIQIVERVVSDGGGQAALYVDAHAPRGGRLRAAPCRPNDPPVMLDAVSIDAYRNASGATPDFLRIGAGPDLVKVFDGAWGTIEARRPAIVFELEEARWATDIAPLCERLARSYRLVRIEDHCEIAAAYRHFAGGNGVYHVGCIPR